MSKEGRHIGICGRQRPPSGKHQRPRNLCPRWKMRGRGQEGLRQQAACPMGSQPWTDTVQLQPGLAAGTWRLPLSPRSRLFPKAG